MNRMAKQFVYGAGYLVAFLLLLFLGYRTLLYPAPGCTNGRQDRGEAGVDCGGVCPLVCLPGDLRPLRVGKVTVFHPAPGRVSALARVENPNAGLAVKRFEYVFTFYGTGGQTRAVGGSSFIYRGEVKYLTAFLDDPDDRGISRAELAVRAPVWAEGAGFPRPELALQDRRAEGDTRQISVSGRVVNNDTVELPTVQIVAVFRDASGGAAGVSETQVTGLGPGERRPFVIIHPALRGMDSGKTDVLLYARRP